MDHARQKNVLQLRINETRFQKKDVGRDRATILRDQQPLSETKNTSQGTSCLRSRVAVMAAFDETTLGYHRLRHAKASRLSRPVANNATVPGSGTEAAAGAADDVTASCGKPRLASMRSRSRPSTTPS